MIAAHSLAVAHVDPRAMAPEARVAELAALFARALVRAAAANVGRPVADVAPLADQAPAELDWNALALSREPERACDRRERRDVPARRSPTRGTPEDNR